MSSKTSSLSRVQVGEWHLEEGLKPLAVEPGYQGLYLLVRSQGLPLGWLWLDPTEASEPRAAEDRLLAELTKSYGWSLLPTLLDPRLAPRLEAGPDLPISVVVCTRDRTESLRRCLEALLALDYRDYEVIVVDNAPSSDQTERLARGLPVRYVREERPGLDRARNRGAREARHDLVAYTDDDVRPDRLWLRAIAAELANPSTMAVTGMVAPAELETEAQVLFEFVYGGMGHGFRRRVVRESELSHTDLLWASAYGVGANMAFRRSVFESIGYFDEALDVGTPSGGGGDVEMFHRLVVRGHTLVYTPAALVWHTHRQEMEALKKQIYDNGRSFGCYLLTCGRNRTLGRRQILEFALRTWARGWLLPRLVRPGKFPRRLVAAELLGALKSPWAYRAAQEHARRLSAAGRT